ncbi:uracil phosphoribosyltransferase [Xiashengella succiniciproducens]|jgi:uracil phosphoribosyltransferase|uniref:Uracil phosphoribosyltransferase n=1 Tax=Xiashengella succiniciproducens TaxID=2949635 RepID=A0A9J6ZQ78_9BACT|nr:uracil phosphoribosyltransferase [Alkaliflexus sp. Ai-910]MDI9538893.1 uracil phosphoribosyltransferase [Bacteroidota bacterium]URW79670.1 uracil phosphoribosyltransferase [Alkaliflexus sp. Ai-910]HHU00334.1 uracil phosphoribosyltransferase [Bacteroidales bacterium]
MKINIINKPASIFNQFIAELRDRDIQTDPMRFRRNLERIGEIFAYEVSKVLSYKEKDIQTPLGIAKESVLTDNVVIASILRAGIPLHNGILNIFDRSENAFVSAYRKYDEAGKFEIHIEYISSPDLNGKTVILADPMLATGASLELAYRALLSKGTPAHVHIVSIIASQAGVDYICKAMEREPVTLWLAAVDEELNAKSYIVPGLGDAGDLAYGSKL